MNKRNLPMAAMLLLGSGSAAAIELAPVVVTPTRTAETADSSLASVTVITRDEIERQQAQSVQDVLRGVAGVSIDNNGGPGKATSVFLRGTNSDHVLVLVDGVKMGSATFGTTAFQDIPIAEIERIEVVRGPRSSLYGSEAIGGVIQIFTRKGGGATKPFFSTGGGSYGTYSGAAGVSGGGERGWYSASVSGMDTEGFNACSGTLTAGCYTIEPDKDGYRSRSGSLHAGYRFENGVEVDAHALRATGHNEFDGSYSNQANTVQQVVGGSARFSPTENWRMSLLAGRSQDKEDDYKDSVFRGRFNTTRDTASFQNDLAIADDHVLTLGVDRQTDRIDSTTDYNVTSRSDTGLFTEYQGSFGAHNLQLSVRRDDNEQFGKHITGGAGWGYSFKKGLRLTASYGTAFKAPTFNQLYYPGYGNPELGPETSHSVEFGIAGTAGQTNWSINAYQTNIDDLIAFDAATYLPANIGHARIRGLEAILNTQIAGWNLRTNLGLLNPENRSSGADRGNLLPRRAKQTLQIDADRTVGKYTFGASVYAQGKRYDDLDNTHPLAAYGIVGLRAESRLSKAWRLQARVENLFDKQYETAEYFNQPGRSYYLTVRYEP